MLVPDFFESVPISVVHKRLLKGSLDAKATDPGPNCDPNRPPQPSTKSSSPTVPKTRPKTVPTDLLFWMISAYVYPSPWCSTLPSKECNKTKRISMKTIWVHLRISFGSIWVPFGSHLGPIWVPFRSHSDPIRVPFGSVWFFCVFHLGVLWTPLFSIWVRLDPFGSVLCLPSK